MKKPSEKHGKSSKQRQNPQQHQHPHPRTFKSGGNCHIKQHGDHFHAEAAVDDGLIDTSLPHIYTREEQNALVWLVFRNRHDFKIVKPNEPLMLMIPDIDPNLSNEYHALERNLGTDANGLLNKVYRLLPPNKLAAALIGVCDHVNAIPDLQGQIALINEFTQGSPGHILSQLPETLETFSKKPEVTRIYIYFFSDKHLHFLEQAYDQIIQLYQRNEKGKSNYTRCTHFSFNDFPTMIKIAPKEINDRAINFFDRISKLLPENSIVFYKPSKQSSGGWRIWETNQPGVYTALLCTTATNNMIGSKLIEAMQMAFNDVGLKAKRSYYKAIEKPTIEIAFSCEKLESISFEKLQLELGAIITSYTAPFSTSLKYQVPTE